MANIKNVTKKTKAQAMGMHSEVLTGRTQQKFFNPDEAENFYYFHNFWSHFDSSGHFAKDTCYGPQGIISKFL